MVHMKTKTHRTKPEQVKQAQQRVKTPGPTRDPDVDEGEKAVCQEFQISLPRGASVNGIEVIPNDAATTRVRNLLGAVIVYVHPRTHDAQTMVIIEYTDSMGIRHRRRHRFTTPRA